MNLQQLEYIIALDIHRNHVKAADHCHVTQPTLSMMVKKLEGELGVKIFDRSLPLKPTPAGEMVISRARHILQEVKSLKEFIRTEKDSAGGNTYAGALLVATIPEQLSRKASRCFVHGYGDADGRSYPSIENRSARRCYSGNAC
jgi:DNA-binding transcriptional LysR family regulator